ncbi:MAG: phage baseplate assembly protein V [Methyloprofundus sp.]|nr:phage baseplate assembly protein V [Methyloprofundus sp.]
MFELTELDRKLSHLINIGVIAEVNAGDKTIRVQVGENLTGLLPWPCEMGRNFIRWRPLRVGQQVVIACPSGDMAQAVIIGMLYSDALDSPSSDENIDLIAFSDGAQLSYDVASHALKATLPTGATTELVSSGGVTINGDVTIVGNITTTASAIIGGQVAAMGDVLAGSVSLQQHLHPGDSGGSTGAPN